MRRPRPRETAVALACAAVLGAAGRAWVGSAPSQHTLAGDCSTCHADRAASTHTPQFVEATHGPPARADRAECLGCHEERECQDCHLERAPAWHTAPFRRPAEGPVHRVEHASIAMRQPADCLECHRPSFQRQCADCHTLDGARRW